ncbi:hypothetical protein PTKIN_Ptkin16aG0034000 [Pterospermum kingtungense]
MDQSLRKAARERNVSDLYSLIQEDANVLKRIDKVEYIDTPLHIAAEARCIDFAMEVNATKASVLFGSLDLSSVKGKTVALLLTDLWILPR